ncbi:MAG TPA: PDZ domain-containing protein, partial [Ktedonobacteraceae bacterium]
DPVLQDINPTFDPEGKYLYFLGYRLFTPVFDNLQFDLGFPKGVKPYAIMLRKDLLSPFVPVPKAPGDKEKEKEKEKQKKNHAQSEEQAESEDNAAQTTASTSAAEASDESKTGETEKLTIDFEGISERVVPFPVPEGRYSAVYGLKGKVMYLSYDDYTTHDPAGRIDCYDFDTYKSERLFDYVSDAVLSRDFKTFMYRSHRRLRVLKAGEKVKVESGISRESGWLDLHRIKVSVQPASEWKQMFAEAWRLQREQFWNEDMSGIDWEAIYALYAPLVDRVSSRSELSDLLWELQGELGTSHAYEFGGEYRSRPWYSQGFLGVDWSYDAEQDRYRIARIVKGDPSDKYATSPLTAPGLNVEVGDAVLAINGQRVRADRSPQALLVNQANNEIQLTLEAGKSQDVRTISVKALAEETSARYREWVEQNRRIVHETSQGQVGYIHIPSMGNDGYAEFHRGYLSEYDYPGLLVDVRWNTGGYVSGLLLEKLARRRVGYDFSRWGQPEAYPVESPRGPMVALTNQYAGSDGDIFSHCFKLMGLGPLIGKRTWGGVIGISPRHRLVDGTTTTQPEFSFWFKDVGWNVENYGTDPDIDVDIAPQDYVRGADPQLERAIAEALRLVREQPSLEPKPGDRPRFGRLKA